jgi:hypothetical protein
VRVIAVALVLLLRIELKRDLILAFSLANLCFLNQWSALNRSSDGYFWRQHNLDSIIFPTLCCEIVLGLLLFATAPVIRRANRPWVLTISQFAFLAVCLIPANLVRWNLFVLMGEELSAINHTVLRVIGTPITVCGAWFVFRRTQLVTKIAATTVMLLAPLVPLTFVEVLWYQHQSPLASVFDDKPLATPLPPRAGHPRIVWVIFDELDQYLAFENRPNTVELPEFDRLRSESLFASHVQSPGKSTLIAMPELISGRMYSKVKPTNPDHLTVVEKDSGRELDWARQPNVFSAARAKGFNTAIIGWHHPYGRLLNESLTYCFWEPSEVNNVEAYGEAPETLDAMRDRVDDQLRAIPFLARHGIIDPKKRMRARRLAKFTTMMEHATRTATDRSLGLVLLHLPVPHLPALYDRAKGKLANAHSSDYLDNLELSDRTLGDLRRAMEANGTWQETTLLVSSDHPFRVSMWQATLLRSDEVELATGGEDHPFIPFILKLAGTASPLEYSPEFSSLLTHDLILAVLGNELNSSQEAAKWLDERRLTVAGRPTTSHLVDYDHDNRRVGEGVRYAPPASRCCAELSLTPPPKKPN